VLKEMNHPFDLDNFESFLSEQADQHRMYASDSVWRRIQESLHGKDRWPALTFGAILTTAVIAVVLTFTYPQKRLYNSPADYSSLVHVHQSIGRVEPIAENSNASVPAKLVSPVVLAPVAEETFSRDYKNEMALITGESIGTDNSGNAENNKVADHASLTNTTVRSEETTGSIAENYTGQSTETANTQNELDNKVGIKAMAYLPNDNGSYLKKMEPANNSIEAGALMQSNLGTKQEAMSRNNFVNSTMAYGPSKAGKSISGKNRWLLQLYATPSISYRYMLEDKKFIDNPSAVNGPLAPYLTNPASDFVQHKPKLGLEIGTAFIYQLTDKFRLKTGLQANYRQFGIQAYATNAQRAMLTLNRENGIDSIFRFSSLSTQSGYKTMNLSSNFLQLAVPVGFDMKIADTRSVDFYVSASGQFTYQIASSYYILSDDYKNYLKQPDIDRKFNINTAVEAFASFDAGGITWQAGPQIRYQLLPGSKDAYPIREHLIDYGFKIGVVKKLK
jgi:hypothetical protein